MKEELDFILYETMDILGGVSKDYFPVEVVLDKGTFDAITLAPTDENCSQRDITTAAKYLDAINSMLKHGGILLITSCNWTEKELKASFGPGTYESFNEGKVI